MNGFISADIYTKLLTPRSIVYFGGLQKTDLGHKNLLIINDEKCFAFATENTPVMTELNQILTSKNVQVKQVGLDVADTVNLAVYDYVLGCQDTARTTIDRYKFTADQTFADNAFQLYKNDTPRPYIYAKQDVFLVNTPQQIGDKYAMATTTLGRSFDFVDSSARSTLQTHSVQDLYENVTFDNLNKGVVSATIHLPTDSAKQSLYLQSTTPLEYTIKDTSLALYAQPQTDSTPVNGTTITIPPQNAVSVSYHDPTYDSTNIFPNPSIESGPWQKTVGDCYSYGSDKKIFMKMNKDDKSDGAQSLQLEADSHVACTGPNDIPVKAGQHYLLQFDYKTLTGRYGAYYISFDDEAGTSIFKRLDNTKGKWMSTVKNIVVPEGAHTLKLLLYAYPDTSGINTGIARYDNFRLAALPDIQNSFYAVGEPIETLVQPKEVTFDVINPTKTVVHVKGASTPFYLETKESYSPRWYLTPAGASALPGVDHLRMNNFMNGWIIDPAKSCTASCTKNSDGTYDMTFVMEFSPQRWLGIGAFISTLTLVGIISYFIYEGRGHQKRAAHSKVRR